MNIKFKRFLRMALCLLLCAVFFTGGVFAAGKLQKRKITVYSGVDIYVDFARLYARDANGNPVEVFIYNGTTYLPVRAVGEAVGKAVQWEAKTSSVYIGQHKMTSPPSGWTNLITSLRLIMRWRNIRVTSPIT